MNNKLFSEWLIDLILIFKIDKIIVKVIKGPND